jgi:opacity protein-like surface antigen
MFKKTRVIVAFAVFISSSGASFAAASPYIGASVGVAGIGINVAHYGYHHPVIAHLFGGYGETVGANQLWYLGGELDAHVNYSKYGTYFGLTPSFMPGIKVTQSTLIYTKLGVDFSHDHHSEILFSTQFGLGVQTEVTKKIALRAEYLASAIGRNNTGEINLGLVYKLD